MCILGIVWLQIRVTSSPYKQKVNLLDHIYIMPLFPININFVWGGHIVAYSTNAPNLQFSEKSVMMLCRHRRCGDAALYYIRTQRHTVRRNACATDKESGRSGEGCLCKRCYVATPNVLSFITLSIYHSNKQKTKEKNYYNK